MILSFEQVEELRAWARQKAPTYMNGPLQDGFSPQRRPVRLEIAAEIEDAPYENRVYRSYEMVVARAFLAEPRCCQGGYAACECGALGERRLG